MKKEVPMTNRDLDVYEIMKDFPETEEDCFLFLRGRVDEEDIETFNQYAGHAESLSITIAESMDNNEEVRDILLNGVLTYLGESEKDRNDFLASIYLINKERLSRN